MRRWGGVWEGCPLPSRGDLGERRKLPQRGLGAEPQPLAMFVHFTYYFVRTVLEHTNSYFSITRE